MRVELKTASPDQIYNYLQARIPSEVRRQTLLRMIEQQQFQVSNLLVAYELLRDNPVDGGDEEAIARKVETLGTYDTSLKNSALVLEQLERKLATVGAEQQANLEPKLNRKERRARDGEVAKLVRPRQIAKAEAAAAARTVEAEPLAPQDQQQAHQRGPS